MKKMKINFNEIILMLFLALTSLLLLTNCSDDDHEDQRSLDDRLIQEYLDEKGIEAEKGSAGFYYSVLESNDSGNQVKENDILSVYYKMSLLNGNEVAEVPRTSENPKKFKVMDSSLIPKGLRLGSALMKEGETFRFYIPSHLAYGYYSYANKIPSNAILIVECELAKIEKEDDQKSLEKTLVETYITDEEITDIEEMSAGIYYKLNDPGEGEMPKKSDAVKIKFVGKYLDGTVFDETTGSRTFSFTIGNESVIEGLEEGIKLMQEGEKASFIIPSHLAYDSSLQVFPEEVREDLLDNNLITQEIPPFSILIFDVELVEIN